MAGKSSRRFHLSDLVGAVLFCGAVAAMFAAGHEIRAYHLVVVLAVFAGWMVVRVMRSARICDECGRRFLPPKWTSPLLDCPHCGERQVTLARSLSWRSTAYWIAIPLLAVSALAAMIIAWESSRTRIPLEGTRLAVLLIPAGFGLLSFLAILWLDASRSRLARARQWTCESCRGPFPEEPPADSICLNCRYKKLSVDQAKKERAVGLRRFFVALGILAFFVTIGVVKAVGSAIDSGNWNVLLMLFPLAILFLFLGWKLIVRLFRGAKANALLSEEGSLARARECAGEEGTVVRAGATTIWYSGPDDPVPMLHEEISAAHRHFETLLSETGIPEPTVRILCFHDRKALAKFYRTSFPGLDLSANLGIYFQRPLAILTLCTACVPGRLDDPRTLAGSLAELVLLEQVYGVLPAAWLQAGVRKALGACGRRNDLIRLNRRMVASLASGAAWSDEIFTTLFSSFTKLALRPKDPRSTQRAEQFVDQAWSIVEYLCGEEAPSARKTAFLAFLKDKRSKSQQKETFFQHFGYGFGTLADGWRQWVLEQGIGIDLPPPPHIREALINRVLPVIQDRYAARADRIQAIRDWRKAGFVLGADALIDLLREPEGVSREEIVLALRNASGMAWGDDPDRWQAWWNGLPSAPPAIEGRGHSVELLGKN